jgi:hypothetical protein
MVNNSPHNSKDETDIILSIDMKYGKGDLFIKTAIPFFS